MAITARMVLYQGRWNIRSFCSACCPSVSDSHSTSLKSTGRSWLEKIRKWLRRELEIHELLKIWVRLIIWFWIKQVQLRRIRWKYSGLQLNSQYLKIKMSSCNYWMKIVKDLPLVHATTQIRLVVLPEIKVTMWETWALRWWSVTMSLLSNTKPNLKLILENWSITQQTGSNKL